MVAALRVDVVPTDVAECGIASAAAAASEDCAAGCSVCKPLQALTANASTMSLMNELLRITV